jgi:hypothetical protein
MELKTRKLTTGPTSYDEKSRSVQAVAATETPVLILDPEYGRVNEVLLMTGARWPESGQVPLCDSHSRASVADVLGSARDFHVVGSELECKVFFSDDTKALEAARKVKDRHLTDFSAGYTVQNYVYVPEGEKQFISGREFTGPVLIATEWTLKELSLTAIGADSASKARSENLERNTEMEKEMIEKIRNEERTRVQEISHLGRACGCPHIAQKFIETGTDVESARGAMLDFFDRQEQARQVDLAIVPPDMGHHFSMGRTHEEKTRAALEDGLVLRGGSRLDKPAAGAEDFQGISLIDAARLCLELSGQRVGRGMAGDRIVREALSARAHTTSDFPYLLANVANKTLLNEYRTAPSTFEKWCNQTDGKDFKEMSRVQLSEGPALDEIPEASEYKYGTFGESREVFRIITKGKLFAITRQAIVNDDLNSITRVPKAFSWSAKNGLNADVYAALVANAVMGDGKALFHADHGNFVEEHSGAAPGIATLTAARLAMRTQTGLNGQTLNISPRFLIIPAALETTADEVLNTMEGYDVADGPGLRNPFYRKLDPIVEPYLDSVNATGWYLAASPDQIDTIEVCFLGGQRTPYLETQNGWTVDGVEYKVRFDYGIKPIDWRGMYFNFGD